MEEHGEKLKIRTGIIGEEELTGRTGGRGEVAPHFYVDLKIKINVRIFLMCLRYTDDVN